jgi:hypothetical protein
MKWIGLLLPGNRLWTGDIEVHYDRFLATPHNDGFDRDICACVELLMRDVWRYVDEVARPGLVNKFQLIPPSKPCPSANDVNYSLQFSVMVGARLGIRMDNNGARPQLLRAHARM